MSTVEVFCDGGARGNPGPAAWGCVIKFPISPPPGAGNLQFPKPVELSGYLGHATNNQAEYQAVINALTWIQSNFKSKILNLKFNLDSQLVVEQLNGNYRIKNEGLAPMYWQVKDLIVELGGSVVFTYIPRLQNKKADALVNRELDKHDI